jgi:hypothetical protein
MLLSDLRQTELAHELEWPETGSLNLRGSLSAGSLHGRLRSDKGWYLATGGMKLDDITEVALGELVHAPILSGGRFVRLANGDYVEVEQRVRRVLAALAASVSGKKQAELRLHPGAIAALRELASEEIGFQLDQASQGWLSRVEALSTKSFPVPEGLRAELRPYQLEGYLWLCRLTELGLGAVGRRHGLRKDTADTGAAADAAGRRPSYRRRSHLRVRQLGHRAAPFVPGLSALEFFGEARASQLEELKRQGNGKVLICSYALLQQEQAKLAEIEWGTAVLDEAQFIKNAQSLRAQAAFRLSRKQRIAATGTPVENHAGDCGASSNHQPRPARRLGGVQSPFRQAYRARR